MKQIKPGTKTVLIDNFGGRLTRFNFGNINSGLAKYTTTFGNEAFSAPGTLTWGEQPVQIDPSGSVITDLILVGRERVESGVTYVYLIGHTGRVYKVQVNNPSAYNPSYDNPVLLATLSINSPTFTRGASLEFYGSTERMFIGHDKGATRLDFDGTNESFVGSVGSWTQNVPRPATQFVGKLYFGNGANIAEVDSSLTVTSYTKLSPGFPTNTQVRDLDLSTDGNYLQSVVSRLALPDITAGTQDASTIANMESFIFWWNGTDAGYTSSQKFPSFSLNSNITFGDSQYTFGYDLAGAVMYAPTRKILSLLLNQAPLPNAIGNNGGFVAWQTPEFVNGFMQGSLFLYGWLDFEVTTGWWRQLRYAATGTETDVMVVPFSMIVSNLLLGSVTNGYAGGAVSTGKIYFSTLETSAAPTKKYKLYKFNPVPTGFGTPQLGVYETQTQMFPRKIRVSEVRVYTSPIVSGNGVKIDLIGADGNVIANTSKTFTAGSNATIGDDRCWYNPQMAPAQAIGVRITNTGTVNMSIYKVELDYLEAGE